MAKLTYWHPSLTYFTYYDLIKVANSHIHQTRNSVFGHLINYNIDKCSFNKCVGTTVSAVSAFLFVEEGFMESDTCNYVFCVAYCMMAWSQQLIITASTVSNQLNCFCTTLSNINTFLTLVREVFMSQKPISCFFSRTASTAPYPHLLGNTFY